MTTRFLVSALTGVVGTTLFAQQPPTAIPDVVSCARCVVRTTSTVALGDTAGPGEMISFPSSVVRDMRGRFWVTGSEPPKVYGADGRFIKELGHKGQGPGEFILGSGLVALPGDSMLVIDAGLNRATVFGPDLKMGRTILFAAFSPHPAVAINWPTLVWGNGPINTSAAAGFPLHAMSLASDEAVVLRSFGPGDGQVRAGGWTAISQRLSTPRGNSVWSANQLDYQFAHWDTSGERLGQFSRTPKWFATQSMAWLGNTKTPPPPWVSCLYEDRDGLVWVFINVPSPHWAEAWDQVRGSSAIEVPGSKINIEKLFVTTVEVIDPRVARVVTRTTLDSNVGGLLADGSAWSFVSDADGRRGVRVTTLALDRGASK